MESSTRQQKAVEQCLEEIGWQRARVAQIEALEDLRVGHFTDECRLGGVKCDVAVRLRNRRLLALECKVSNSGVNSIKRLIHEAGNKAKTWHRRFGEQVIPGAVLAGVYELVNLRQAQEMGLALFWEHNLGPLTRYVRGTEPNARHPGPAAT